MNESKSIDNPRIKIVKSVGAKAQDVKMRWIITKTIMGVVFSSPTKEIGTWQIFVVDFRSQLREMPLPKPLNT